jgi:2-amino-4-hydroxy-6-hydroxymethyldihydropteridine diphosphokinase
MARIYIGVGCNSTPEQNIASGLFALMQGFGHLTLSPTYVTQPVGCAGDEFYNLVVGCDTSDDVYGVVEALKVIESTHGRQRGYGNGAPVPLDLDLLTYDSLRLSSDQVSIPRVDISKYAYVLKPLARIAPHTRHPETGETYQEMWNSFVEKDGISRDVTYQFEDVYRLNQALDPSTALS